MYLWCHLRWIGQKPMRGQVLMLDGWEVRSYTNIPSPRQPLVSECGTRGPACLDRSALHWTRRFLPLPTWWLFCLCTWIHKSASQHTRSKQGVLPQVHVGSIAGAQFPAYVRIEASSDLAALLHLVTYYCQCCHVLCSLDLGSNGGLFADSPLTSVPAWWHELHTSLMTVLTPLEYLMKFVGASLLTLNRCLQLVSSDYVKFFVSFLETSNSFSVHYILVHPRHRAILWASRWMKLDFQLAS